MPDILLIKRDSLTPVKNKRVPFVKFYFDPSLEKVSTGDDIWIYSPSNHEFLKIKKSDKIILNIIDYVIEKKGNVDVWELKNYLQKKFAHFSYSKIMVVINKLFSVGKVFYANKKQFLSSVDRMRKIYNNMASSTLWQVYLHITHRCNFNCWYCYNRGIKKSKKDEVSVEEWQKIIKDLIHKKVHDFIITGGEPLLRAQALYEIIKKTRTDNTKFTLLTNGSLFNKKIFRKLNSVIDNFIMSLDSLTPNIQARNRSAIGFKNIIRALEIFSQYAPQKLTVRSVMTKNNQEEVDKLRIILKEKFGINNYQTTIFLPNRPEEIKLMPQVSMEIKVDETFPTWFKQFSSRKYKCGACSQIIAVDCRGDVYPCQNFIEESNFRMAKILEKGWYRKVLSSPIRKRFLSLSVENIEECRECAYRYLCGGGCPAISWRIYKSLCHHLPFMCEYLKYEAKLRLVNAVTQKIEVKFDEN